MSLVAKTIEYASQKQPVVLLVLFHLILQYLKKERDRIEKITEADIKWLGEKYSIPVELLKEDLRVLQKAEIVQTGTYSFKLSSFKQ